MAFSGDKPIVESVLYDLSGSAIALATSASIDLATQSGVVLAGVFDNLGAPEARLLKLDSEGRLFVTGALGGTISLDNGASALDPLFVSGSVNITNSSLTTTVTALPAITGSVNITNLSIPVTFPSPQPITGSVVVTTVAPLAVTGSVGISTTVTTHDESATASSVTPITAVASLVTLLAVNTSRKGGYIYNTSNKHMFVKLGAAASSTNFTYKIFADAGWEIPKHYTGIITGLWAAGPSGAALVTELT